LWPKQIAWTQEATAFPIEGFDDSIYSGTSGHLYSSEDGNPIPLVCSGQDVPNLAVLFHQPFVFSTTKRFKAAMMYSDRFRMNFLFPNRTDEVMGFLTRVGDTRVAEGIFGSWGTGVGPVTAEMGHRAYGDPETHRRRRERTALLVGLAIVAIVAIRLLGEAIT
jgi:hypothetical protein